MEQITENSPTRLVFKSIGHGTYLVAAITIALTLFAFFGATYSIRADVNKLPHDLALPPGPEPMLNIARCPLVHFSWLRSFIPDQCHRTFIRLSDINKAIAHVHREEDDETGDITFKYSIDVLAKPIRHQTEPLKETLEWLKAKSQTLTRTTFEFSSKVYDTEEETRSIIQLINSATINARDPRSAISSEYEETSIFPILLGVISATALLLFVLTMSVSEDLIFDARHQKLFIQSKRIFGIGSSTKVISLDDIIDVRVIPYQDSMEDPIKFGIQLVYSESPNILDIKPSNMDQNQSQDQNQNHNQNQNQDQNVDQNQDQKQNDEKEQPDNDNAVRSRVTHFGNESTSQDLIRAVRMSRDSNDSVVDSEQSIQSVTELFLGRRWSMQSNVAEVVRIIHAWLSNAKLNRTQSEDRPSIPASASNTPTQAQSSSPVSSNANPRQCAICLDPDSPPTVLFLPCRHIVGCYSCCSVLTRCPVCRNTISEKISIRTNS